MPATIAQARDEILSRVKKAIDASEFSSVTVLYEDARGDQPREGTDPVTAPTPPASQTWLRCGTRHSSGRQASLGGAVGSRRRQEMSGIFYAQVFTPAGDGHNGADKIVQVVLDAYRTGGATPNGVQFRSARFQEVGKSGAWYQTNCLVDFTYDQFSGP